MNNDCIFCDIVSHKLPASIIFEDENVISFLDIRPLFPGHSLIVPKLHYATFYDLPDNKTANFFNHVKLIGHAIEKAMQAEGSFIAMNNIVSQSVPHFHVHVVPRNKGDGLKGFFWPRSKYESDEEMRVVQKKIIAALAK